MVHKQEMLQHRILEISSHINEDLTVLITNSLYIDVEKKTLQSSIGS